MANEIWTIKRCLEWTKEYLAERGDEALATGSGEGQGPTKLERAEEAAALPDDEAVASSI